MNNTRKYKIIMTGNTIKLINAEYFHKHEDFIHFYDKGTFYPKFSINTIFIISIEDMSHEE